MKTGNSKQAKVLGFALSAMLLALSSSAQAQAQPQQQAKVAKIGELIFRGADRPGLGFGRQVFRDKLRELGFIEGKNVIYETRFAESKLDRYPALADELVRLKVDVLVASSTPEALAFRNATKTIPVVFTVATDPVADGLVDSLARPGGNVTGVTAIAPLLAGKRLELLKETIPKLSRVAVLQNQQDPGSAQPWKESRVAAQELGLQLHTMEVSSAEKFEAAFKEATKARSTALAVGSIATSNTKLVTELAAKYGLPAVYDRAEFVTDGGLMSYGPDRAELYKRAAVFVDKILKGTKPADLPVEQPKKFELVINLKAAKQIGLTIPPNVLARADRVFR
jgi:putative tryptophan/tyrosine transport system substrate-binding protein